LGKTENLIDTADVVLKLVTLIADVLVEFIVNILLTPEVPELLLLPVITPNPPKDNAPNPQLKLLKFIVAVVFAETDVVVEVVAFVLVSMF
tara:strand:+ start:226 stop:498 length:273 start_codon:yes stop_codon:yes gene_type:complete